MKNFIKLSVLIQVLLFSCEKEEKALAAAFIEDRVGFADMVSENGLDYQKQVYFDLSRNKNVGDNFKDEWDFAFGCEAQEPNIFVNSALLMRVAPTGISDFSQTLDPKDFEEEFQFERSKNYFKKGIIKKDFHALDPQGEVFIIDLGLSLNNQARGYKKFQILEFTQGEYKIQIADLNSNNKKEYRILGDANFNNVYLSLSKPNEILKIEPPKEDWDIVFTKYMQRLFDGVDSVDYSVTGCLLNPFQTQAYLYQNFTNDSSSSFYNLKASNIIHENFSDNSDVIGHEWKRFDLNGTAKFIILAHKFYFIQDNRGVNYRLRFTGFYNQQGDKGSVSFEFLEI